MTAAQLDVALDRPLPQSTDAERAVLGSVLINNNSFYRVLGTIDTPDFFKDAHRTIFAAMRHLAEQSREIDLLTLKDELGKRAQLEQVGGSAYISSLVDGIPDIANVERYARIVKEKSTLRRLIVMGNSVMRAALDTPNEPSEVLNTAEKTLYEIAEGSTEKGFVSLERITKSNMTAIEQSHNAGRLITGIPTGYDRFNEFTSGFQPQDLIIIAARPSMGKTSLMMNIAESIAIPDKSGQPRATGQRLYSVGVFSLEMSKEQLAMRMLSAQASIDARMLRTGSLSTKDWSRLAEGIGVLADTKLHIDDTPGISVLEMRA
ncbi:MAG: replicative DNA helicase, partial [Thermoanaerobaculia bacterium]